MALRTKFPVFVRVIAAPRVMFPAIFVVPVPANVPVNPVQLKLRQERVPEVVTVTVPLAASRNTSSTAVGTASPPAPPEVSAHLEPAVAFQVSVPPPQ